MTVKDIEKRIIGCTSTTKNMSGVIVPIQEDGQYFAFISEFGNSVLPYNTYYQVDNVHDFVKTYIVDFMYDIEDVNKNIYYLFIPNFKVGKDCEYIDDILNEIMNNLDYYKQYRQLYAFLKQYESDYIMSGINTDMGYFDLEFDFNPEIDGVHHICDELDKIIDNGHQEKELTVICYNYDYGRRNDVKIIKPDYNEYSMFDNVTLYSFTGCNVSWKYLEGVIKTNYNEVGVIKIDL